ncbi:MAG: LysM peptidoglycan-binding domain-containing protein, partial [Gammaproteobacteria bacterium]|nr:LysM peptidoglycan-binding domain-containing protein [Gammaproteobacteria bacterium]
MFVQNLPTTDCSALLARIALSLSFAPGRCKTLLLCTLLWVASSLAAQAADWQYTVRPGDTVWSVCEEYTSYPNCWRELPAINDIAEPRTMAVGQRIRVPANWLKVAPVAATIIFVHGEVLLGDGDGQSALKANQQLEIGSRITTGQGSATLQFLDGSLLTMSAFSEITLDAVSAFKQSRSTAISVSVPEGEVSVRVPP